MADPYLSEWSRDYWMVGNSDVRTWSEPEAHMDERLYDWLASEVAEPVIGFVDGVHYNFKPSREVMSQECAIPGTGRGSESFALLVQK